MDTDEMLDSFGDQLLSSYMPYPQQSVSLPFTPFLSTSNGFPSFDSANLTTEFGPIQNAVQFQGIAAQSTTPIQTETPFLQPLDPNMYNERTETMLPRTVQPNQNAAPDAAMGGTSTHQPRLCSKDWDNQKDVIAKLWLEDNLTLADIMGVMKEKGFSAR